jgi:hypothetical protein
MPLAALKVVGPISTLVTTVRVQGQSPGAKVLVISLTDQQVKASGIATRFDQRFGLLPSTVLNHGDRLVATQRIEMDTSNLPSKYLSISVYQAPKELSEIGAVVIEANVYFGDEYYLWISGCIPGAVVEAFFQGKIQGQAVSDEGVVRLKLSTKSEKGEPILVRQMVKGVGIGPSTTIMLEPSPGRDFRKALDPLIQAYG